MENSQLPFVFPTGVDFNQSSTLNSVEGDVDPDVSNDALNSVRNKTPESDKRKRRRRFAEVSLAALNNKNLGKRAKNFSHEDSLSDGSIAAEEETREATS